MAAVRSSIKEACVPHVGLSNPGSVIFILRTRLVHRGPPMDDLSFCATQQSNTTHAPHNHLSSLAPGNISPAPDSCVVQLCVSPLSLRVRCFLCGSRTRLVYCGLPEEGERQAVLRALSRNLAMAPGVDLAVLASMTDGFTGG